MSFQKLFKEKYNPKTPTPFIVKLKANSNGELDELTSLTVFLDSYYSKPPLTQRLNHFVRQSFSIDKCPICNKPLYYREKPNPGYLKTCGDKDCKNAQNYVSTKKTIKEKYSVENISQTSQWRDKVKATNMKKRGAEWNTQTGDFVKLRQESWQKNKESQLEKRYKTNLKRYGVKHATQSSEVNLKVKESMKTSYEFKEVRVEKIKNTNQERYGTAWFMSTDSFNKKKRKTLFEKYGVHHNSHNAKTLDKRWASSKNHDYVFPSGKIVKVQGYEPKAIDELLKNGYMESDIVVGNTNIEKHIGKIIYTSSDNKEHRYFPDIYVISENKVIEVKSEYTLSRDFWINNKRDATVRSGFTYELKVY